MSEDNQKNADTMTREVEEKSEEAASGSKMEELLKQYPVKALQEGKKIKGSVLEVDSHALFVDLGEYGTGIVYGKEIKDGIGDNRKKLKLGDEITATVVDLENEDGYTELSVREAMREEAWKDLHKKKESKEVLNTKILDANKGGLMVEVNGIIGFMPVSQLSAEHYPRVEDGDKNKIFEILKSYVDTEMKMIVLDINEEEEKLIVSEKEAYKDEEKEAISEFKVGDVVEGEVSGVVDFGAFVKFMPPSKKDSDDDKDKLEGLVHISQLDWKLINNPRDFIKVGDKVKAKIIDINETRVSLSIRDLKNDPWANVESKYKVGDIVDGTVNKINHFGAFVYLDKDIHGLAHISEFISKYPNKNIDEVIIAGETYKWQIMSMDPNEHRMGLKFIGKGSGKKEDSSKEDKGEKDEKEEPASAESSGEAKTDSAKANKDKEGEGEESEEGEDKKAKEEKKASSKAKSKKADSKKTKAAKKKKTGKSTSEKDDKKSKTSKK